MEIKAAMTKYLVFVNISVMVCRSVKRRGERATTPGIQKVELQKLYFIKML